MSMIPCSYRSSTEEVIAQRAGVWLTSLLVISVYLQITYLSVGYDKHGALRSAGKECKSTHEHPTHAFLFLFVWGFFFLTLYQQIQNFSVQWVRNMGT